MDTKLKKAITLIISLFLGGSIILFIGLSKGEDIATNLFRPESATDWSTSMELILGCKYTPAIMGISLMILSIILSTILFKYWIGKIK